MIKVAQIFFAFILIGLIPYLVAWTRLLIQMRKKKNKRKRKKGKGKKGRKKKRRGKERKGKEGKT